MTDEIKDIIEEEDTYLEEHYTLRRFGHDITNPAAAGFMVLLDKENKRVIWLPVNELTLQQNAFTARHTDVWHRDELYTVSSPLDVVALDLMNSRMGLWELEAEAKK